MLNKINHDMGSIKKRDILYFISFFLLMSKTLANKEERALGGERQGRLKM